MLLAIGSDDALSILGVASIVYVFLCVLVSLALIRPPEWKLLALGLLTGVLAAWFQTMAGSDVQVKAGGAGGQFSLGREAGGVLARIAVLLILAAGAVAVLGRIGPAAGSGNGKEAGS
jgi:hypothetical protein